MKRIIVAAACALGLAASVSAPKGASSPRTADGHPDLNGIWGAAGAPPVFKNGDSVRYLLPIRGVSPDSKGVLLGLDRQAVEGRAAAPNKPEYRPELLAKVKDLSDK